MEDSDQLGDSEVDRDEGEGGELVGEAGQGRGRHPTQGVVADPQLPQ